MFSLSDEEQNPLLRTPGLLFLPGIAYDTEKASIVDVRHKILLKKMGQRRPKGISVCQWWQAMR